MGRKLRMTSWIKSTATLRRTVNIKVGGVVGTWVLVGFCVGVGVGVVGRSWNKLERIHAIKFG